MISNLGSQQRGSLVHYDPPAPYNYDGRMPEQQPHLFEQLLTREQVCVWVWVGGGGAMVRACESPSKCELFAMQACSVCRHVPVYKSRLLQLLTSPGFGSGLGGHLGHSGRGPVFSTVSIYNYF